MTTYTLPLGTLARPLAACCELNGARWYGFHLLADKPSLKWYSEAQLAPINPHMAAAPAYDVAPDVYPKLVFLAITNVWLEGIKQRVTRRMHTAYVSAELAIVGEVAA